MKPDRVVIGVDDDEARAIMGELYAPFTRQGGNRILFMDIASAEVTKYAANAMLATRISFMNQMALFCELVGADVNNVRLGIGSDQRIGRAFLYPGPGYGGSCFPKDVKAIIQTADDLGLSLDVLKSVESVNECQKLVVLHKVQRYLGADLSGKTVGLWGLAFKAETDDMRESPTLPLIEGLLKAGARVQAHDPKATDSAREIFQRPGDVRRRSLQRRARGRRALRHDRVAAVPESGLRAGPQAAPPPAAGGRAQPLPAGADEGPGLRVSRDRPGRPVTRVLVTGAAGFIGSHLVEALSRRGDEVIGIDNFDPFYPRAMKERNLAEMGRLPGFTFHEMDLLDVAALRSHLSPDTVLVHLAAKAGVRPSLADPVGYARVNVTGTAAVAEAARAAGVSRILFGSSSSVYGDSTPVPFREDATAIDPVSPYAATKRAGELFLRAVAPIYGFRVASLRFFTVYGPRQRPDLAIHAFTRKMIEGKTLTLFGDGTQARDYTYCDDIVAGVIAALEWSETGAGRRGRLQPRRQPLGDDRGHGGRDLAGARDHAHDRVGADAAGRRAAHRRRSLQVGRRARLRARHPVSGGNPALRRLVPGCLWPRRLSTC